MLTDAGQYQVMAANAVGSALSNSAQLQVLPNNPPSAPVITSSGLQIAGHPMVFNLSSVDPEGDQITFIVTGMTSTSVGPTAGSGSFSFTPPAGQTGSQTMSVTVVARDSKSASSNSSTFTWTEAPNHVPQFFSLAQPPAFTGSTPVFNVSFTVVAQDQDTDDVRFDALSAITVVDNNGAAVSGATPSINAATGVITWAGTVPATATSVIATFTVTAKDYLPGTTTAIGGSNTQVVRLSYEKR